MTKILHIQSSPRGSMSHSLELSSLLLERLNGEVTTREVFSDVPFVTSEQIAYMYGFATKDTASQDSLAAIEYQEKVVEEVLATDVIVFTVPLWNLGMPASIKAWFDQVIRVGHTWKMDETGAYIGLATNVKKVYIVGTSSGIPVGVGHPWDFLTGHLTSLCKFIGAQDVQILWAQGNGDTLTESMNAVKDQIGSL